VFSSGVKSDKHAVEDKHDVEVDKHAVEEDKHAVDVDVDKHDVEEDKHDVEDKHADFLNTNGTDESKDMERIKSRFDAISGVHGSVLNFV
jgi:hypothetical protein